MAEQQFSGVLANNWLKMASASGNWLLGIIVVAALYTIQVESAVIVQQTTKLELIVQASEFLCSYRLKVVYVYFGNQTSLSYPGQILQHLSACGISYISMRERYKISPLEDIKDDGVLMYMVMILHDASQSLQLSMIQKKSAAKHLSHVFLLIQHSHSITQSWLRSTFKKFWKIWLLNIVIIYWHNEQLQIYRYNPFRDKYLIPVQYQRSLPQLHELFPKSLPNMHRKTLRFCMYPDEIRAIHGPDGKILGADGLMSNYIAESLNATPHTNIIGKYSQSSEDLCMSQIKEGIDDIAINIRFLAPPIFRGIVEPTIVLTGDDLCVLVPKAKMAPTFWNIFRSFNSSVWLAVILSLLLMYIFCMLTYWRLCRRDSIILQLFGCILSMPLTHVPSSFSFRLFVGCWIFYCLLISSAFKGNVMINLAFRTYLPDINTIEDLALSPYKLIMFERHKKHLDRFLDPNSPCESVIRRKMTTVPDEVLSNYIAQNNLSYAYLEKEHVARYQVNERKHMRYGLPLYHLMSTCIIPFHAVYIVPYGSPYLGFVNRLIRSSHEFGFYIHWVTKMNIEFLTSGKRVLRFHSNNNDPYAPVVLKLAHLNATFCLLGLGLGFALLVFGCELLWKKLKP